MTPNESGLANGHEKASANNDQTTPTRFPRIRLRMREPTLVRTAPGTFPTPRRYSSFSEWLQKDDPLEGEEGLRLTDEQARREAQLRLRIAKASEPRGTLTEGVCARWIPEPFEEPQPRYGHWSYVSSQAVRFHRLMQLEHERHVKTARQLAYACMHAIESDARWTFLRRKKPPALIAKEQIDQQSRRKKQLVNDMKLRWQLAKAEVNHLRLQQWEKEQEALGKEALDEMLDKSTRILYQHRMPSSSVGPTDSEVGTPRAGSETDLEVVESDSDAGSEDTDDEDSEDMSSSNDDEDSGAEADEDQNLSPEALRQKYADALLQQGYNSESSEEEEDGDDEESEDEDVSTRDIEEHLDEDAPMEDLIVMDQEDANRDFQSQVHTEDDEESVLERDLEDYHPPALEEVDDALLDEEDESTDMDSDIGSEEDDSEGAKSGSEEDEDEDNGLMGFFSKKDIRALKSEDQPHETTSLEPDERHKAATNLDRASEDTADTLPQEQIQAMHETRDFEHAPTTHVSGVETTESKEPSPSESAMMSTASDTAPTTPSTPRGPSRVEVPTQLLRGTLREYQHDGLDWLAKMYAGGRNGILADEMGLGKTIQTIALLAHLAVEREVWGPHLIVVPTSVILNWEMEFKKWCPGFKILTYYGTQEERKRKRQGWLNDDRWNVVITSYQLILQDTSAFKKRGWHYLVLDEAHNIKNFQTQRWQTLLTFKTHSRLLLTGTPLQNNLQELWSLLYFLMPAGTDGAGGFADLEKFLNSMKTPAHQILDQGREKLDAEAQARVKKLHEVLRPYLLRRLKSEVEKQMPAKYEHVVYCRLSKRQRQLYDEFMGRADTKRTLASGNYMSIINCLMSLRKVCNHPDLFETRQIVTSLSMTKSAVADYEIKELLVRRRLLSGDTVDLELGGLVPAAFERFSRHEATRLHELQPLRQLEDLAARQIRRLQSTNTTLDNSNIETCLSRIVAESRQSVLEQLQSRIDYVKRIIQRWPIYGTDLVRMLTMPDRFHVPQPNRRKQFFISVGDWYVHDCRTLYDMMPTLPEVAERTEILVRKFSCVTPAVVAEDITGLTLTPRGQDIIRKAHQAVITSQGAITSQAPAPSNQLQQRRQPYRTLDPDPYHEARIRLSIQFPDKRLLQYDCGKLQALDKLLRDLQAGGHRCLIFTQMTKVLDILEQFLNIHGHRYLRLDGATKIEQRQILTDRFNSDPRILAFILSSRSGGLGINLTGADTVIFYDLDWNPAMDKQCQDRCHRIGQTRDVHIYRFVSEYTIEANILRKSNQKRLLDDVIIQKGEFTTDYFNRVTYRDSFGSEEDDAALHEGGDAEVNMVMDRVLNEATGLGRVFESVEDKEDTFAAKVAAKENAELVDTVDFNESTGAPNSARTSAPPQTPLSGEAPPAGGKDAISALDEAMEVDEENAASPGVAAEAEEAFPSVDEYMVRYLQYELRNVPVVRKSYNASLQKAKKKAKDTFRRR